MFVIKPNHPGPGSYAAMQHNPVVRTNEHAVRLWRSLGCRIMGTVPHGFRLPDGGIVAHHTMYRSLR